MTPYKYNFLYAVSDVQDGPGVAGGAVRGSRPRSAGRPGFNESQERNHDGWGLATGVEHRLPVDALDTELHRRRRLPALQRARQRVLLQRRRQLDRHRHGAALRRRASAPRSRYSHLSYRNPSTYPDPDDPGPGRSPTTQYTLDDDDRSDDRWIFAVELEKYITDAWSASLRYSYTNNNSNVDVFAL